MQWLKKLWSSIASLLGGIVHFIGEAWIHYDQCSDDVNRIVTSVRAAVRNIEREVSEVKNFKFDPRWRTRVINVPIAIEQVQNLKALLLDDFKNRLQKISEPVHELSLILHQESAPAASDPQGAVNALAKAEVKLGHVITMIHQVREAMDEITNFIDVFRQLREAVENLEPLFLQQGNPKKVVDVSYRQRQRLQT